ncbi:hypothetical protein [Actinoplanes sp. NPDC049316]|uniref:hypothetical protein n=1 Tax=Actinoplanes sp. NPDC049316 TaxID=3154727 RepID=UPI003420C2F7
MADLGYAHAIAAAAPEQFLRLERDAGHSSRFTDVDQVLANLIAAALAGAKIADIKPGPPSDKNNDTITLTPLNAADRAYVNTTFSLTAQQARGAWSLPEQGSLKAGIMNLPAYIRHDPWYAITRSADDVARVQFASTADAVAAWSLLIPLFERLMAPVHTRAAGSTDTPEEQTATWEAITNSFDRLGLNTRATLSVLTYRGGWSSLDRTGQARARAGLLDVLAGSDLQQLAARYRAERVQALAAATGKKAKAGTPLARKVLTRSLQPVLSAYFAGDWLAFLDYLGMPPNPNEEVVTALPTPKLYVSGAAKAATVAADHGLDVDDVHAMLAAFMGQDTSVSAVDKRVEVMSRWWTQFDALHAKQTAGMPALWGLREEGGIFVGRRNRHVEPIYRTLLTTDLVADVDQLWDGIVLPRWPETIVSEPYPHRLMAETFGPAVKFWEGVALTAWYICEGPYSRTSLEGLRNYHQRDLRALEEAGTPIHQSLFEELANAEQYLGPAQEIGSESYETDIAEVEGVRLSLRISSGGQRRDGFEILRDIVTRHRQGWTRRYLGEYLQFRWNNELSTVARELHRLIAVRGKPPTFRQFAKLAAEAANHWFNGDLSKLYTTIGEKAPAAPRRVDLLPTRADEFVNAVYLALGGQYYDDELHTSDPKAVDRYREIARLAARGIYYLQIAEATGQRPEPAQFGIKEYEWNWAGGIDRGWPVFEQAIDQAIGGFPSLLRDRPQ